MTTPEEDYPELAELAETVDEDGTPTWGDASLYHVGPDAKRALVELAELRRWKAEALQVLGGWDAVYEAAGEPGTLGASKAANVKAWIESRR